MYLVLIVICQDPAAQHPKPRCLAPGRRQDYRVVPRNISRVRTTRFSTLSRGCNPST